MIPDMQSAGNTLNKGPWLYEVHGGKKRKRTKSKHTRNAKRRRLRRTQKNRMSK
jgi:hypothetical protein